MMMTASQDILPLTVTASAVNYDSIICTPDFWLREKAGTGSGMCTSHNYALNNHVLLIMVLLVHSSMRKLPISHSIDTKCVKTAKQGKEYDETNL